MTENVSIETRDACVDFPIFDAKSRSLKKAFLGQAVARSAATIPTSLSSKLCGTHVVAEGRRPHRTRRPQRCRQIHPAAPAVRDLRAHPRISRIRGRVAPVFDLGVGMDPEISGYENIIIRGLFLGRPASRCSRRWTRSPTSPSSATTSHAAAHLLDRHARPRRNRCGDQHRSGDPASRRRHRCRRRRIHEEGPNPVCRTWSNALASWFSRATRTNSSRNCATSAMWIDHGQIRQRATSKTRPRVRR